MLRSLLNTGISANLTHRQYAEYANELAVLQSIWERDISILSEAHFTLLLLTNGIDARFIPEPVCQYDYDRVIYHSSDPKLGIGECRRLSTEEPYPIGLKSIADGGTVPCSMLSILKYFQVDASLLEVGNFLVKHGYRSKRHGTRWIAIDKILEINYGIETTIITSVLELARSLSLGQPVLSMVNSTWLHNSPNKNGNKCIIIWKLQGSKAIITTTTSLEKQLLKVDLQDLLKHILRAWSCRKIR